MKYPTILTQLAGTEDDGLIIFVSPYKSVVYIDERI